jgi:hypothetical protein
MKAWGSSQREQNRGLSVPTLADLISDDVQNTARTWLLSSLPLALPEHVVSARPLITTAVGSTLRFAGVMTGFNPETGYAILRPYGRRNGEDVVEMK